MLMTSGRGVQRSPGEFRRNQVWIGGHRADEATFVPPANQLVDCWEALENFINDVPQPTAAIIKAALSHVQFETIHPFLDGNGHLGRMLIPLILVGARILQEPLLYLSVFFKQHRATYYSLLQQVRISGNWEAWLLFFADAIAATANQAVSTAQALTQDRQGTAGGTGSLGGGGQANPRCAVCASHLEYCHPEQDHQLDRRDGGQGTRCHGRYAGHGAGSDRPKT